jgi:hypothetical protein
MSKGRKRAKARLCDYWDDPLSWGGCGEKTIGNASKVYGSGDKAYQHNKVEPEKFEQAGFLLADKFCSVAKHGNSYIPDSLSCYWTGGEETP